MNDGAGPRVRIIPDKRNDQIASSPKEEKRRFLNNYSIIAPLWWKTLYIIDIISLNFFLT